MTHPGRHHDEDDLDVDLDTMRKDRLTLEFRSQVATSLLCSLWPNLDWSNGDHNRETPIRFVKMLQELTTPIDIKWKTFPSERNEMVIVKDINFHSLCAHHVIPFMGVAHVAYIPNGQIVGISKLARVVKHFAAKLQVQEDLTGEIADYLEARLTPTGVAVVLEAEHLCMSIRGVQAPGTKTVTSCMLGAFADHSRLAREEFLRLIGKNNG